MSDAIWLLDTRRVTTRAVTHASQQLGESSRRLLVSLTRAAIRRRFLISRALMRAAAASWSRCDPRDIAFHERPGQAPVINGGGAPVFVSLSHTREWIACALDATPVGLDIEHTERPRDVVAMSALFFAEAEHAWLLAQPDRAHAFYELWTGKEAMFKLQQQCGDERHLLDTHFHVDGGVLHATGPTRELHFRAPAPFLVGSVARAGDSPSRGALAAWIDALPLMT